MFYVGFLALLPTARQLALAQSISPTDGCLLSRWHRSRDEQVYCAIRPVQAQHRGSFFFCQSPIALPQLAFPTWPFLTTE